MRKGIFIIAALIILIIILYRYGRSIYMPIVNNISEKETIQSIQDRFSEDIFKRLQNDLSSIGLNSLPNNISILAFKEEMILEIWTEVDGQNKLLKSYPFSATSGTIGPKLKEGDKQIPEGIYKIEYLNPNSSYYLSLKVNYPNAFDQEKAIADGRTDIGSDIFIHGKNVTVGCIPLGDSAIEELFILASTVKDKNIDVIISPKDFRKDKNLPKITSVEWSEELYANISKSLKVYK
ncbi:L,D-transpeptidase family protein [Saprospiraceae bacterium]|nr:L,D-transpeptidase family protein [Saprospiraceae bacterium]